MIAGGGCVWGVDRGGAWAPLSNRGGFGGGWCVCGVIGESAAVEIDEEEALAWPQPC